MRSIKHIQLGVSVLCLVFSGYGVAEKPIMMTTTPTYGTDGTRDQLQPLADYLTKTIGRKFVVVPTKNFIDYGELLKEDKFDLVYDGPHFMGWRVTKRQHRVIVKTPGEFKFLVVVSANSDIKSVEKLAGKRVCGLTSPNLMTLGLLDLFANPASVPSIVPVESFEDGLTCVRNGEAVAAVIRNTLWLKLPEASKEGLRILYAPVQGLPNLGFTVSQRIDQATAEKIKAALLSPEAKIQAPASFKHLKIDKFVPGDSAEYADLGRLLRPIWGFHE